MKVDLSKIKKLALSGPAKFVWGMVAGAGVIFLKHHQDLTLVLKDEDIRELRVNPGCAVYDTEYGPLYVAMNDPS